MNCQDRSARGRSLLGRGSECGPETLESRFTMLAGHDRMHPAQVHRATESARANRD